MWRKWLQRQGTALMGLAKRGFQTVFLNCFNGRRSHFQRDPFARRFNEEPLLLQIGEEFTFRLIISVGNIVTRPRAFSGDLTNSGHYCTVFRMRAQK